MIFFFKCLSHRLSYTDHLSFYSSAFQVLNTVGAKQLIHSWITISSFHHIRTHPPHTGTDHVQNFSLRRVDVYAFFFYYHDWSIVGIQYFLGFSAQKSDSTFIYLTTWSAHQISWPSVTVQSYHAVFDDIRLPLFAHPSPLAAISLFFVSMSLYCVVLFVRFYWVFTLVAAVVGGALPWELGAELWVYLSLLGFCWTCFFISKTGTILSSPLCFIRDVVKR